MNMDERIDAYAREHRTAGGCGANKEEDEIIDVLLTSRREVMRLTRELADSEKELSRYAQAKVPERVEEIEAVLASDFSATAGRGFMRELLAIVRGMEVERELLIKMLAKVTDYLESANEIIEGHGDDNEDTDDTKELIGLARKMLVAVPQ